MLTDFNAFYVPRIGLGPASTDEAAGYQAIYAMIQWYLRDLLPEDSWPIVVAKEAVFIYGGKGIHSGKVLDELYNSDEMGPIGFVTVSLLLSQIGHPSSSMFAQRGLSRLSFQEFEKDALVLLSGKSVLAKTTSNIISAVSDLKPAEIDALAASATPVASRFLIDGALSVKYGEGDMVDLLRTPLENYWETELKNWIKSKLEQLAGDAQPLVTASADRDDVSFSAASGQQSDATSPSDKNQLVSSPGTAFLYVQGQDGEPGRSLRGDVIWNISGSGEESLIEGEIHIYDFDLTAKVAISNNMDDSLPASHLVDIEFRGDGFASKIESVPELVLKQTEKARGQPLTGAAVPVTETIFWIALSNDPDQVERNIALLRSGHWFDVPIVFDDGTKGLLTFEKGSNGMDMFASVMANWGE